MLNGATAVTENTDFFSPDPCILPPFEFIIYLSNLFNLYLFKAEKIQML